MKKVDYYAMNQSWKMPKWLGATIGGVFGLIAIASVVLIVQLTKSPEAPKPAVAAAAAVAAPVAQDEAAPTTVKSQDEVRVTAPARAERTVASHSRHGKHHDKHAKAMRVASAKRPSGMTDSKAQAILAKHEGKSTRKDKDALDKLLGL